MKTCAICDKDFLEEDIYECGKCHKRVCPDHIVSVGTGPDDPKMNCTNCMEDNNA